MLLLVERGGGLVVMVKRVVVVVERRPDLGDGARVEPVLDNGPQRDHKVGRVDDVAVTHELGIVDVELVWVRSTARSRIGVRVKAGLGCGWGEGACWDREVCLVVVGAEEAQELYGGVLRAHALEVDDHDHLVQPSLRSLGEVAAQRARRLLDEDAVRHDALLVVSGAEHTGRDAADALEHHGAALGVASHRARLVDLLKLELAGRRPRHCARTSETVS